MKLKIRQHGATLITALVMLIVLTLLVISAVKSSTVNLRIASNMQVQGEAVAAAQQAIENVISNNFSSAPAAITVNVPMGGTTYAASTAIPKCIGSRALLNSEPNLPPQCLSSGTMQNTGIKFSASSAVSGTSWCYAQQWDVAAAVTEANTGASVEVHQGVSLNVPAGTSCI